MSVKGPAIAVLPLFIKERFGKNGLDEWLGAISPQAKKVYTAQILPSEWYPIEETYLEPTKVLCDLFYGGDPAGAREIGAYSADYALKGVYKAFVKMTSVKFFVSRTASILQTYYKPCTAQVVLSEPKRAALQMHVFPKPSLYAEMRIAGWTQRAFEIHGCKNPKVEVTKSLAKGDPYAEFYGTWE
jgi:hypothetical protein